MNAADERLILQAIAISSVHDPKLTSFISNADRQEAFRILEQFKAQAAPPPTTITTPNTPSPPTTPLLNPQARITLCLQWLQQAPQGHVVTIREQTYNVTTATQLLALEVLASFLSLSASSVSSASSHSHLHSHSYLYSYASLSDSDRHAFRQAVLQAARQTVGAAASAASGGSTHGSTSGSDVNININISTTRIVARKLASILTALVLWDFPQRWTSFAQDIFAPYAQGGLWFDDTLVSNCNSNDPSSTSTNTMSTSATSATTTSPPPAPQYACVGVHMALECLKRVAEDCTDSDFNVKIPTARRNDVLTGLQDQAAAIFLPRLFQLLERYYPALQQVQQTLHQMHLYLWQQQRTISTMTPQEAAMYQEQIQQREHIGQLLADTLITLETFAKSMPIVWIMGTANASASATATATASGGNAGSPNISSTTTTATENTISTPSFVLPLLHLFREPIADIHVHAVECMEQLSLRGKWDWAEWMRMVRDIPAAVQQAHQVWSTSVAEYRRVARQVGSPNGNTGAENMSIKRLDGGSPSGAEETEDPTAALILQLSYHRALSRLLASLLNSHIAHIVSSKSILQQQGTDFEAFSTLVRLTVELLHHPSGRVCTEQVNMWSTLLRDPQTTKSRILAPYLSEVVSCYMDHMVRVRWDDEEDDDNNNNANTNTNNDAFQQRLQPVNTQQSTRRFWLEASFDDEEAYDAWMADLRSRASLLFKFAANTEPSIAAQCVSARVRLLIERHGDGSPLHYLDPSNGQVTQKSDAVMLFEGLAQPLENILSGLPSWSMDISSNSNTSNKNHEEASLRQEQRRGTIAALSEMAQALVAWNPAHLWLKFRKTSLLEALKYYWKHDPSTLLQGVDCLIRYLGLPDEWRMGGSTGDNNQYQQQQQQQQDYYDNELHRLSPEMVGLKKRSGVALVSVARMVPNHLVPWLSQLSEATRTLLSSEGLIPMNQMHLYEFLSCVATAVEDPVARSNFIGSVLASALETLESADVQKSIASVPALLDAMGVHQAASDPASLTNPQHVKLVTARYHRLFTSLNQLLSVGRRCQEAARKIPVAVTQPAGMMQTFGGQFSFPDEGPVSIQDLAINDPFVPLWPRILPILLQVYEVTLGAWRPEHQTQLLSNPYQRYLYAISEDEAFLSKTHDAKSGGVFGEGGTAGSVVAGASRRDINLVPKWSGWFNELRNTCFQMMGLLATQRVLFAPELAHLYPRLCAILTEPWSLRSMEHRHFVQFLKHIIVFFLVSCPTPLYKTHLEPILSPILEHIRIRLDHTWRPVLLAMTMIMDPTTNAAASSTRALTSATCASAALLAARANEDADAWFSWFYAHGGLFVGDVDAVTAEAVVEKCRFELGRTWSDVLQIALALKGDWALVLANQAKEEQAHKKNDATKLNTGPKSRFSDEGIPVNADGTPKTEHQAYIDAQKLLRINGLCHFLLLESELIAGNLTLTIVQSLGIPDAYSCRRVTKICHRILETVAWAPQYAPLLGQHLFTQAIKNIVTEPKWMVGMEWDMINVIRDIYCRLVLGQTLQFGGQGAGQQQSTIGGAGGTGTITYEQAKTLDRPLQGGGILTVPSELPRQFLMQLPGLSPSAISEFENQMKQKRSAKDQKDAIRDLLRVVAEQLAATASAGMMDTFSAATGAAVGSLGRAMAEESLLHSNRRVLSAPDLTSSSDPRNKKSRAQDNEHGPEGLAAFKL